MTTTAETAGEAREPGQGLLAESLARYQIACAGIGLAPTPHLVVVRVEPQRAYLFESSGPAGSRYIRDFVASTSRFGIGQVQDTNRTPLGLHAVAQKIGAGLPAGTIFESRVQVGTLSEQRPSAAIVHRILWLEGLQPGFNRGGEVDTFSRYVYIHGTSDEMTLGRPASRGCVHLGVADLIWLFDQVAEGAHVWIEA